MPKLFILVKRKGAKNWRGAIPAKKNLSRTQLAKIVRRSIKPGFTAKIVNEAEMRRVLRRLVPKTATTGKRRRRPITRVKRNRKRKTRTKKRRR